MRKQIFLMIAAAALFLTGCNSVDLSPLEKRVAELEGKVNAIEKSVSDLNSNASGLKTSVDALKQKLTVVSVEELRKPSSRTVPPALPVLPVPRAPRVLRVLPEQPRRSEFPKLRACLYGRLTARP